MTKRNIIEELCYLYRNYLSESEVYDGASFWSNDRVNELADKLELSTPINRLKVPEKIDIKIKDKTETTILCNQWELAQKFNEIIDYLKQK